MKTTEGFLLRQVAGQKFVVAVGAASKKLNGIIELNDAGAMLWDALTQGATQDQLAEKIMAVYEIDEASARRDVEAFLEPLWKVGCIE